MSEQVQIDIVPKLAAGAFEDMKHSFAKAYVDGVKANKGSGIGVGTVVGGAAALGGAGTVGVLGMAKGLESVLGVFVDAINPAMMKQFSLVIKDMTALFGNLLIPVVETVSAALRIWADFLASVLPSQKEVRDIMQEFAPLMQAVKDSLAAIAPDLRNLFGAALQVVGKIIQAMIPILVGFMKEVAKLWAMAIEMLNDASFGALGNMELAKRLRNIGTGKNQFAMTSTGASGGGAMSQAFGGISERAIQAAFGIGMGPQERAAQAAEKQLTVQEQIAAQLARMGQAVVPFNGGQRR